MVLLIGARLNWLLSHGKGKTWGGAGHKDWGKQKYIQIDISPTEMDSNVRIDAPLVGDVGSCVSALLEGIAGRLHAAAGHAEAGEGVGRLRIVDAGLRKHFPRAFHDRPEGRLAAFDLQI